MLYFILEAVLRILWNSEIAMQTALKVALDQSYLEINTMVDSSEAGMKVARTGSEWISANYFAEIGLRAGSLKYGDFSVVYGEFDPWRFLQ